jgi:hypothetical protein
MDFTHDGDTLRQGGSGGGGALAAIMGALLMKDNDKSSNAMMMLAVIIILIVFFIAIIFLALTFRKTECLPERGYGGTDYAGLIAAITASGALGNGNKQCEHDKIEIMQKLEHNEDRRVAADTQKEIAQQGQSFMQMGFGLSGQVKDAEIKGMENFAKLEYQMGELNQGMKALLTEKNNDQIINGVINRLWGSPCGRAC